MKTEFWLFGQFEKTLLPFSDVQKLVGLAPKTIRNMISAGKFPRPIPGDSFAIQDVADWIDQQRKAG